MPIVFNRLTERSAVVALAAVPVGALGFADGGFYPRPWGWAALGLAVAAAAALLLRRELTVSRRPLLLLCLLAALSLWTTLSLSWTRSTGLSVLELQRLLVYGTGVGAAVLLVRARDVNALLVGVFVGTTCVTTWGLVSYLLTREEPTDVFQGSFLSRPMGYANAMGIVAVIALLLALGVAADSNSRTGRVGAGIALVPLASALALTGSRASWAVLPVGAVVAAVLASDRVGTLRAWAWLSILPSVAVVVVTTTGVTNSAIVGEQADRLGDRLLATVIALTSLGVVPALVASNRTRVGTSHPLLSRRLVVPICLVGGAAVLVAATRLAEVAGDRPLFWRVAAAEFEARPVLGSGAGTYAQVWLERRPTAVSVHDAHSIVLETLSELGIVGLTLVLALLGTPLLWGLRARGRPMVPAATAAFAAFAAHAAVDWDWELPAVTLAGLFCAVAVGLSADHETEPLRLGAASRTAGVASSALAAVVALTCFVGASSLETASRALARGDPATATRAARRAERLQPWSAEASLVLGQAELLHGDRAAAHLAFAHAAERDPRDYRTWLALASVTEGDAALAAVLRARRLNPLAIREP